MAARAVISQAYLRAFHQRHPGITEAVLERARVNGMTAYQWLAHAAPEHGRVLDLACGSAPMRAALGPAVDYAGVDRSPAELAAGRAAGVDRLVRADAALMPIADSSIDAVTCSMALMILQPLDVILDEIHRVLCPGGLLLATVPGTPGRIPRAIALVTARLLTGDPAWQSPNTAALRDPRELLARHGFALLDDDQRTFTYPLRTGEQAGLLLDSLYLPGLTPRARRRALRLISALRLVRAGVPIPIRRLLIRAG
ncbi:class I SAM-dependent methyltransferase [Actinocrinis puniceicyclus]|uniref:Class I SAM-dependent methyltransferase n=1 Tax=Actinocrinis puniceicyclus TaxID=977794 RepID=A0A8J7WJT1_9ACTN|nr:class I SAM-dependent methyltransferase [Actinocrinis puniceicyclus]MBS2963551.1 class I SAM-dependent methyltransferase [Actinocrinis puniceicyclus]